MAKLCEDGCHIVCDFCKHYKDEDRDIKGLDTFEGEGICDIDGHEVDASGGCNNFECFRLPWN